MVFGSNLTCSIFISLLVLILITPPIMASLIEDDSEILNSGVIFTQAYDYQISNEFSIKNIITEKLFKISGTTTDGHPFYAYHRMVDGEVKIIGKVIVNGNLIPIIQKEETTQLLLEESSKDLALVVKHPFLTYPGDSYQIIVKVFDKSVNSSPSYNDVAGILPEIKVHVDITHENGTPYKELEGLTNENGIFSDSFFVLSYEAQPGKYIINVKAEDGENMVTETLSTFIEAMGPVDGK